LTLDDDNRRHSATTVAGGAWCGSRSSTTGEAADRPAKRRQEAFEQEFTFKLSVATKGERQEAFFIQERTAKRQWQKARALRERQEGGPEKVTIEEREEGQ